MTLRAKTVCEEFKERSQLRSYLDIELHAVERDEEYRETAHFSTQCGGCTTCTPLLKACKHVFQSLLRQGAEPRHCKNVLPKDEALEHRVNCSAVQA